MKAFAKMLSLPLTAVTLFAVPAFSQSTSPQAATPVSMTIYEVPVPDDSLKPFASFQIERQQSMSSDGLTTIRYKMPRELTGRSQITEFVGTMPAPGGESILTGANGEMVCQGEISSVRCQVRYTNLKVDVKRRTRFLEKISQSPAELKSRLEVARGFDSDPFGIMTWSAPY